MQQPTGRGAVRPPIGIAFDGDVGNRIDAVLAIAMLNGLTAKTQARRIIYRKETPMSNFHLTLMDRMGVPMENFGDSSGMLDPASLS